MTARDHEAYATPYHAADGYTEDGTEFHLPEDHWPLPELVHLDKPHAEPTTSQFVAVHGSPEFKQLRRTFRTFAFPMTIAAWGFAPALAALILAAGSSGRIHCDISSRK